LAALRILEEEARIQDEAMNAARQTVAVSTNQYRAGTVRYLDVIVTQATALANERTAVDIRGRRMVAAVLLVKALGGGWDAAQLAALEARPLPVGRGSEDVSAALGGRRRCRAQRPVPSAVAALGRIRGGGP
jgi:hypothetical protein